MVRAHWRPSVVILLSVTVLAAVVVKFLPKSYTATTTLIVNSENKNPLAGQLYPLDPMAAMKYVAPRKELMLSPVTLLPVGGRLKLPEDKEFSAGVSATGTDSRR